jgi:TonB-linked SusC/RagA family outer membrane protein
MRSVLPLVVLVLAAKTAAAQGSISVTVNEAGPRAIAQAQVAVVNTTIGGLTGQDGKVTLRGVPAGQQTVRVLRVGYAEQKKTVTVENGQTASVEITLSTVAVNLTPVVTTATGETRRVEIGNAVSSIDVSKIKESSPIASMNDLLNARSPGVQVTSGTQTGSGARIRIRGTSSLNLGNDPIYVIDGVRMTSNNGSATFGTGGSTASRVNDISPEEIENIEIVKGPSAATLYGTDAANGVIVITTKKGRAGSARWNVFGETGALTDLNPYPYNYTIAGHSPGATAYRQCGLPLISAGSCIFDSLRVYSPLHDADASPLGTGYRGNFGASVQGGTDAVRYFIQASREKETGLLRLPDFERRRFSAENTEVHAWTDRPNLSDKTSFRANLNVAVNPQLDVAISTGFTTLEQRYTLESNATAGLGSQAFGGAGYKDNGTVAITGTPLNGYRAWTPGYTWQEKVTQGVNRFVGSAQINWRPTSWLQNRIDIGNDFTDRVDNDLRLRGEGPPLTATYRDGYAGVGRTNIRNFTANVGSTATWNAASWLNLKTTIGAQYVDYRFDGATTQGTTLSPGSQTASGGTTPSAGENYTLQRTLGQFIEEAVAINDRLFLTGAVRSDQNSAFGTNFQSVIYPKIAASWLISEESWWRAPSWVDNVRFRYAWGSSGVQPGPNDALRTYAATSPNIKGTDVPGLVASALGNSDLKPESTSEVETGFEARFFKGRASIDFTYYYKKTKDALISAIVAPSYGAATSVRRNLGGVRNSGFEGLITGQLVDRPWLGLDVTINASINENRLLSLGGTPPQNGTQTRTLEGWPLFGLWSRAITGYSDKNKDGILTYNADPNLSEVQVSKDTTFRGYSAPRQTVGLTTGIDLFRKRLRLTGLLDWRSGNKYYNNTERIRCVSRGNCQGLMQPNAPLEEQAMVVATLNDPSQTIDGFFQPGAFVKLREVAATYTLPTSLANSVKAKSASITFSARNVWKWTKYRGVDPESDYTVTGGGDNPSDFQTIGAPSYFIFRFSLGY